MKSTNWRYWLCQVLGWGVWGAFGMYLTFVVYKESFEKDASEIDDVENLLVEWNRLLKLNKQLCVFMFSQHSFPAAQPIIEMLIIAKDIMTNNIDVLTQPLKSLYARQAESLVLYNTICKMNKNASKIHKNY